MASSLNHVQPGDLITAADWNGLVDSMTEALARIAALEAGGAQHAAELVIEQVVPDGPYRVGDTLKVLGRNFQYSIGAATVFVGPTQVFNLLPSSNDSMLQFVIPPVDGVTEAGTNLDLIVLNRNDSRTTPIVLKPRKTSTIGNVFAPFTGVKDNQKLDAGAKVTFLFGLRSGTNNRVTWTLAPLLEVATNLQAWTEQLRVVDDKGNELASRTITLEPGATATVGIQLKIPANTAGTEFAVTLNLSGDGINGSSGVSRFTVGNEAPQVDTTITYVLKPALCGGALVNETLTVKSGGSSKFVLSAIYTVVGTYDYKFTCDAGWTVDPDPNANTPRFHEIQPVDLEGAGKVERLLRWRVSATDTAKTPGVIQLSIQRRDQPEPAKKRVVGVTVVRT